ncbi:amidohydrolase family protein [Sphingomonas piscis]|uniref:Amidohydrolase family protein n=1 Tax=Sphingomonas piscis TaxID=2714943 RepID=A0A6G7YPZ1_9SPHN|nr:amidohydrolase family protein [Sphingomonas piscis]QIK78803.1 amidohydrolase family protein [Sphingomonas piscis]
MIDAHQHYWQIGKNGHEWPTADMATIHRDYLPDDWAAVAAPLGIGGSIAVQSQANDADTDWLLTLAQGTPSILGVVGWTELKAPDAAAAVRALAARPKLKGLRPMLQNLADDNWIADPALDPAIAAMVECRLRFDALVFTRHLPPLRRFAERWSDLPIVVDHGAKPPIAAREIDEWRREMTSLAALPNVCCKLSGLFTEMSAGQPRFDVQPYIHFLLGTFGPNRLMWGSDWPVLLLAGEYREWFDTAAAMTGLDRAGQAMLFGGTAARFYGVADSD